MGQPASSKKRAPRPFHRFRWTILLCSAALLLVLAIFFSLTSLRTRTHEIFEEMTLDTLTAYTYGQRERTQGMVENIRSTLEAMAASIASSTDTAGLDGYLKLMNDAEVGVTYAYISSAAYEAMLTGPNAMQEQADTLARLRRGETVIANIRTAPSFQGHYYFAVGVPVFRAGTFLGAVRGLVDADVLVSTTLYNSAQGEVAATLLTDADGVVLPISSISGVGEGENLMDRLTAKNLPAAMIEQLRQVYATQNSAAHCFYIGKDASQSLYYLSVVDLGYNGWHLVVYLRDTSLSAFAQEILRNTVQKILVLCLLTSALFLLILLFYRKMQEQISQKEQQYQILASFSDTVLFEYDCVQHHLSFTSNAADLFGMTKADAPDYLPGSISGAIHPQDRTAWQRLLTGAPGHEEAELRLRVRRPGKKDYFWCLVQCKYLRDAHGNPLSVLGKLTNIERTVQNEAQLLQQAETDPLTGLRNKGAAEHSIAARMQQDACGLLFVLDMDNFKGINDHYGHAAGDQVLKAVGQCLLRTFRPIDIAGRIGGDEMVAYLSNIDNSELAAKKVELLRKHIELCESETGVPCSVSIGIAHYPTDAAAYPELFRAADKALYAAKRKGKGRYCLYEELEKTGEA